MHENCTETLCWKKRQDNNPMPCLQKNPDYCARRPQIHTILHQHDSTLRIDEELIVTFTLGSFQHCEIEAIVQRQAHRFQDAYQPAPLGPTADKHPPGGHVFFAVAGSARRLRWCLFRVNRLLELGAWSIPGALDNSSRVVDGNRPSRVRLDRGDTTMDINAVAAPATPP